MEKSLDEIIASGKPQNRSRRGGKNSRRGPIRDRKTRGNSCVLVLNVHKDISDEDLRDLFRQAGPVLKVKSDRDESGKRPGMAWILFQFAADAEVAVGRFDNRRAAGQVIKVRAVERIGDLAPGGRDNLKDRIGGRGKGRKAAEKPRSKKPKTQEELDAELDSYMKDDTKEDPAAPAPEQPAEVPAPETAPEEAPAEELMIE